MHKTGNEEINGVKTFSDTHLNPTETANYTEIKLKNTEDDRSCPPTSTDPKFHANAYLLNFIDKFNRTFGALQLANRVDSSHDLRLYLYDYDYSTSENSIALIVGYDENGTPFANCPPTSEDRDASGDILTRNWIPKDTRIVHRAGAETIEGMKTFDNYIYCNYSIYQYLDTTSGNKEGIIQVDNGIDISNKPANTRMHSLCVLRDKNDRYVGTCQVETGNDGSNRTFLTTRRWLNNAYAFGTLAVWVENDGTTYATCPTPEAAASSTKIATTAWVRNATGNTSLNAATATAATTATKLATARSLKVALGSTTAVTFDGSSNQNSIPISGTLGIANGGTGATTRLDAFKAITNASLASSEVTHFAVFQTSWAKAGYATLANVKTALGIGGSDKRIKQNFGDFPENLLDAWEEVPWIQFKFMKDVVKDGEEAKLHAGTTVQDIQNALIKHGVDSSIYGMLYHEKYEDEEKDLPSEENPEITNKEKWYLKYEEALCVEAAYQRRRADRAEARIKSLEERLSLIESKLNIS